MAAALRAALIDVGGTLWPDGWHPAWDEGDPLREERLRAVLPASAPAAELLSELKAGAADDLADAERDAATTQGTDRVIRAVLARFGLESEPRLAFDVRSAMASPVPPPRFFLPGAGRFLAAARRLGLRSVILSNTFWRDSSDYRRDFEALGVSDLVDGIVTSVDVGVRKPHPAILEAGIRAGGCEASECVMVGNSEPMDVEPALAFGMRAIRVAIEEPVPDESAADAVVASLDEAADVLRAWVRTA
ncbi:MAG: HAD family hydrolase [Actinomycetota bacterium]